MQIIASTAATALAILASAGLVQGFTTVSNVKHTFYGFPDNSPPGPATAFDCGRGNVAGGAGTFDDPRTFASAPGEFNQCEIVWDPYTEKYLRFEDTCDACETDFNNGINHIDIWTGSSTVNGGKAQIDCEDELTPNGGHDVIRFGSQSHTPNTGPLFSTSSGCHPENVFPNNN